jgi:hypothetical protein
VKNKKYERGGRFKVKVHILFCGNNSWTVAVSQMKYGIAEDHGHTYKFYFIHYFFNKLLNMTMVRNFEVMLG